MVYRIQKSNLQEFLAIRYQKTVKCIKKEKMENLFVVLLVLTIVMVYQKEKNFIMDKENSSIVVGMENDFIMGTMMEKEAKKDHLIQCFNFIVIVTTTNAFHPIELTIIVSTAKYQDYLSNHDLIARVLEYQQQLSKYRFYYLFLAKIDLNDRFQVID
ncbi:MAG: hypothetical protein EZS28_049823, partial [Streblomastix strix]